MFTIGNISDTDNTDNTSDTSDSLDHSNSFQDENIIDYMQNKEKLSSDELCIYFYTIMKNLLKYNQENTQTTYDYISSIDNIDHVFKKNSMEDLKSITKEYFSTTDEFNKKISILNKDVENLSTDINHAILNFDNNTAIKNCLDTIYSVKIKDIMVPCKYKDFCKLCSNTTIYSTDYKEKYCVVCPECDSFRKYTKEHETIKNKKLLFQKLDEEYNKKHPAKTKTKNPKLPNQVNINNTYININCDQKIYNQTTIVTQDRFFEVFISNDTNDVYKLKNVFIYYMCRLKAAELYPDEEHNLIASYPVSAALYTIKNNNILHGILRYKHSKNDRMTSNKLKNITTRKNNKCNITVNQIKNISNVKNNFPTDKLTEIIKNITADNSYGSIIDDFYVSDLL
jgi:hypothetical protein